MTLIEVDSILNVNPMPLVVRLKKLGYEIVIRTQGNGYFSLLTTPDLTIPHQNAIQTAIEKTSEVSFT